MITNILRIDRDHAMVECDGKKYVFDYEVSVSFIVNHLIENGHVPTGESVRLLEEKW